MARQRMLKPRDAVVRHVANLGEWVRGRRVESLSIGPAGEAIALLVSASGPTGFAAVRARAERPIHAEILCHDGVYGWQSWIPDLSLARPFVQPLPNDELLLVYGRCVRWPDGTAEHNAQVYGTDGRRRRTFVLGDGIADVQTTRQGDIWVSYFDEGVFGNGGWGGRSPDSMPIGRSGLMRFDANGRVRWTFDETLHAGKICDCYALNVRDDAVWAYYYADFGLSLIKPDGTDRHWRTGAAGATVLAVDGRRVLLLGGYDKMRYRCVVAELQEDETLGRLQPYRLAQPSGETLTNWRAFGRGPIAHFFVGLDWHQLDLRELPAA